MGFGAKPRKIFDTKGFTKNVKPIVSMGHRSSAVLIAYSQNPSLSDSGIFSRSRLAVSSVIRICFVGGRFPPHRICAPFFPPSDRVIRIPPLTTALGRLYRRC